MSAFDGLLYGVDYFAWQNQESVISTSELTINRGTLQPSGNTSITATIKALAFDPSANQLRLNWIESALFPKSNRVLVVNGPLYLLKGGLLTFPQRTSTHRKGLSWNLQDGNLQVFFSLDWFYRQQGNENQYEITPTLPTTLDVSQTNVSTLVQQFDAGPMVMLGPPVSQAVPLYANNSAKIKLTTAASSTRYTPYTLPTTEPTEPTGLPNTMRPYRNGTALWMRLLTGGVAYVVKNVAYKKDDNSISEYTVMYGPYRTGTRNSQSPLSDIPVLQPLIPSRNSKTGIRFDLSELFFAPNTANPDHLVQVARPGIGLPYAVMVGGLFNSLSGGVFVKGSALVTGVLGAQLNNDAPNRSVIDWSTGAFQSIDMAGSGRSVTFVDPTYNGAALPPTTLYLFVKRTGNGTLTFAQANVLFPDADADTDTPATRSDEWELTLVNWSAVDSNWPLYQVYTFIYTGTHYLGAYSGLYNTNPNGNGRRF